MWAICAEGVNNDRYPPVTDYLYLRVLCYPESGFDYTPASGKLVRPYLTMQRLIKDFFESLFDPAVRFDGLVNFVDPLPGTATFQQHRKEAWISDNNTLCHTSTLSSPLLADLSSHMTWSIPPDGQSRKEVGKGVKVEKSRSHHSRVGELDYYTHSPLADAAIAIDDTIPHSSQSLTEEESFNFEGYDDTRYSSYTMNSAYKGDLHRTCNSDNETPPPSPESLQCETRLSVLSDQNTHQSKYRLSGIELGERNRFSISVYGDPILSVSEKLQSELKTAGDEHLGGIHAKVNGSLCTTYNTRSIEVLKYWSFSCDVRRNNNNNILLSRWMMESLEWDRSNNASSQYSAQ